MNPEDLYQEIILDHASKPRNHRAMENPSAKVEAENPLCGDEITVFLKISEDGSRIENTTFLAQACAICTASGSLMTTKMRDLPVGDAKELSAGFQELLTKPACETTADLRGLNALEGVKKFPMRIKCATLAWHALDHAIAQAQSGGGDANLVIEE